MNSIICRIKKWINKHKLKFTDSKMSIEVGGNDIHFLAESSNDYDWLTKYRDVEAIESTVADIKETDLIWDVGAHIGLFALPLAPYLTSGAIICFEPSAKSCKKLVDNCRINSFGNIAVYNIAMGENSREVELSLHNYDSSSNKILSGVDENEAFHQMETVQMKSGDEVANQIENVPNVVKIDAEGYEYHILQGMDRILSDSDCRMVICEVHEIYGVESNKINNMLEQYGFGTKTIDAQPGTITLKGERK